MPRTPFWRLPACPWHPSLSARGWNTGTDTERSGGRRNQTTKFQGSGRSDAEPHSDLVPSPCLSGQRERTALDSHSPEGHANFSIWGGLLTLLKKQKQKQMEDKGEESRSGGGGEHQQQKRRRTRTTDKRLWPVRATPSRAETCGAGAEPLTNTTANDTHRPGAGPLACPPS